LLQAGLDDLPSKKTWEADMKLIRIAAVAAAVLAFVLALALGAATKA
jgi:hypothetical protein